MSLKTVQYHTLLMGSKTSPASACVGEKKNTEGSGVFSILPINCVVNLNKTAQAGIKIAGRNIRNLRYADDTPLMAESEDELKSLLMKVKE